LKRKSQLNDCPENSRGDHFEVEHNKNYTLEQEGKSLQYDCCQCDARNFADLFFLPALIFLRAGICHCNATWASPYFRKHGHNMPGSNKISLQLMIGQNIAQKKQQRVIWRLAASH